LSSSSLDVRHAAAVALTRVGISALPALGTVEAALEDPLNLAIRDTLLKTRDHLRSYLRAQERIEVYRRQLLHDKDGQARAGAAFSLGQYGELAVVAIPDLEIAARDPRNRSVSDQMQSVIEKLRLYEQRPEAL